MELDLSRETDEQGRPVLVALGSIDLASKGEFLRLAAEILAEDGDAILVDLDGITFLDSVGIGALVQLRNDAGDAGRPMVLRNPSARVTRVLELSGLRDLWPVEQHAAA